MSTSRIYIVRHGETAENRAGIIQGQLDTEMNAAGEEQAALVADALQLVPFERAYSSDLRRATKTAEAILKFHPGVELLMQEELRERYMGEHQGKSMAQRASLPSPAKSTIERGDAFDKRTLTWWNKSVLGHMATLPPACMSYHILVVTHGGFIGTLVRNLLESKKAKCGKGVVITRCFNASVTVIEVESNQRSTVVMYGDITHLADERVVEENVDEVDIEKTVTGRP